jgi:hypothetical protein
MAIVGAAPVRILLPATRPRAACIAFPCLLSCLLHLSLCRHPPSLLFDDEDRTAASRDGTHVHRQTVREQGAADSVFATRSSCGWWVRAAPRPPQNTQGRARPVSQLLRRTQVRPSPAPTRRSHSHHSTDAGHPFPAWPCRSPGPQPFPEGRTAHHVAAEAEVAGLEALGTNAPGRRREGDPVR